MPGLLALVFDVDARAARTLRSLAATGLAARCVSRSELLDTLRHTPAPLWLIRSGAWQPHPQPWREIPPSATGKSLIGLGHADGASLYLDPAPAALLAERLAKGDTWAQAVRRVTKTRAFRCVPLREIAVRYDAALRVVQLVTTIQIGGAERVTLDLAEELNRAGVPTAVAAFGQPTRRAFPAPRHFADLSEAEFNPYARAEAVARLGREWGADLVHAHLIRASEAEAIRAHGFPLVVSVHNVPPSWPAGYLDARTPFADLFIGCAEAVSREIAARLPAAHVRTVWNGIDARGAVAHSGAGLEVRAQLGWDASDFVLIAVANPRGQKRLDRLPEIMALTEERIAPRRVRLLLAGEPACGNDDARDAMAKLEAAMELWHTRKATHWTGAVDDVAPLLAAADAFISTSTREGLSLAQLEALAAGLPIVATNVGGAAEVAAHTPRVTLLPREANAEDFAKALALLAIAPPPRTSALPRAFTRERMAARARLLYGGLLVKTAPRTGTAPLWLLANNFSTGGAQTSARRLLTGLAARGVLVRAATIEEERKHPTEGRRALGEAGIEVAAIVPHRDPENIAAALLEALAAAPPRAVLFWNLIAPVKVLLADALDGIPIFDVSPGEMFFRALDRLFAGPCLGLRTARDYGARLAGVVVKYHAEAARAAEVLGAPVTVIPNGVPLPPFVPRVAGKRLILGTAARLAPDKRLDQLLDALRRAHPHLLPYRLRIAGGVERGAEAHARELRRLARGLPVEWCGEVRDVPAFLAGLDVFAMISEPAGCPNALLEALAAGLPIVATDHGGAGEQIIDGVTGRLVPRGDAVAFAKALVTLASDPKERARLSAAAREHAAANFPLERMLNEYSALCGLADCTS